MTRFSRLTVGTLVLSLAGCTSGQPVLLRLVEARQLAGDLHTSFVSANEAANRAVMADTDDVSVKAAEEAKGAMAATDGTLTKLDAAVKSLGYGPEAASLDRFQNRFEEYRSLQQEVLALAVENTNLKAQRLSFGASRELGEAVAADLVGEASGWPPERVVDAQAIRGDVFELLFDQSRHIAETDDAAMAALESRAASLAADVRSRFRRLKATPAGRSGAAVDVAEKRFASFMATHDEVIALSRRNTNVRSIALTLGRNRLVAAQCDLELATLQRLLAAHGSEATR